MNEVTTLTERPEYQSTMDKLEKVKRVAPNGIDYWHAREILAILGYADWDGFAPVLTRAMNACDGVGISPPHHFRQTSVMMKLGKGGQRSGVDYWLTRAACYLVAMNGDPAKAEIAAAQAYFARQTRRMEQTDQLTHDERRLEMRERVKSAARKVSGVAQEAGVKTQAFFHDARYQGMYHLTHRDVKKKKGLAENEKLFDRIGALELSMHDFQMNLAADVISRDTTKGDKHAISVNRQIGERVRSAVKESGGRMPEELPLEPPIAEVKKRVKAARKLSPPKP